MNTMIKLSSDAAEGTALTPFLQNISVVEPSPVPAAPPAPPLTPPPAPPAAPAVPQPPFNPDDYVGKTFKPKGSGPTGRRVKVVTFSGAKQFGSVMKWAFRVDYLSPRYSGLVGATDFIAGHELVEVKPDITPTIIQ